MYRVVGNQNHHHKQTGNAGNIVNLAKKGTNSSSIGTSLVATLLQKATTLYEQERQAGQAGG